MHAADIVVAIVGYTSLSIAAGYSLVAFTAVLAWRYHAGRPRPVGRAQPPVTVLKPLCGDEPGLYEHLCSFCRQDYPQYQLVFGSLEAADPALTVVARLAREFPDLAIDVVVNPQRHGHNNKSSNLINMLAAARHPILVVSDSDVWVKPDYLTAVTAPLGDPAVGLVTCLSHDSPTPRLWSRLGAMYVNEWYFPSVMLAWLFGHQGYASGQTLCLRRSTLDAIGGLRELADHLADDYRLGQLILARGLRIVLSPHEVRARHHEPDLAALARHELRWMRTLHIVRPMSLRMIFLTFSLPLAGIGLLLTGRSWHPLAWVLFGLTALARFAVHFARRDRNGRPVLEDVLLVPVRDLLICWLWCQSFFSRRVSWRGHEFDVDSSGTMHRVA